MVDAILEAMSRLLRDIGFEPITTNHVADLAGVSVGSLYQYFPNKESLLSSLLRREVERNSGLIATRLVEASSDSVLAIAQAYGAAIQQAWSSDPELAQILFRLAPRLGAWRKIEDLDTRMTELLIDLLRERRDEINRSPEIAGWVITRAVDLLVRDATLQRPELIESGQLGREVTALIVGYLGITT